MKNAKVKKIDQFMNAMCQMQCLERTFTLCFVVPFNLFTPECSQIGQNVHTFSKKGQGVVRWNMKPNRTCTTKKFGKQNTTWMF